ncbi:hypothetical protein N9I66_06040 [Pseudomonadales bacterium]|nr:hypothetical protein [Pseudomonadales bacterium]
MSSLIFYGFWKIEFIPIMLASVMIDYFVALKIPSSAQPLKKRLLLVSLLANLGLLFYFKYLIFFSNNAIGFANLLGAEIDPIVLKIILPLGISFYTFQTISYTIDCYRGVIKPEKDFVLYASYVTFFPQLVAGPVLRASEVIGQLRYRVGFSWIHIAVGLRRITYGLFLKVVIADNISPLVDSGFMIPLAVISAIDVWTLAFLFGFQIYFDFCAYSHIALGSARLMGIQFPENFNFPYVSSSPKEFWRRWHISLSSWIRDYLYLPLTGAVFKERSLGGLETATVDNRNNTALFASWTIMGLWHGANWTFVLWGFYHAVTIFIYRKLAPKTLIFPEYIRKYMGLMITLPIMMLAWIPFRADSIEDAFTMWLVVLNPFAYSSLGMRETTYLIAFILLICFFLTYWVNEKLAPRMLNLNKNLLIVAEVMLFASMLPLVVIYLRPISQFIYFQF